MKPIKLTLIGAPGSGKGTQAQYIKNHFNIPHISSGNILRNEVKQKTDFGLQIKEYMDRGEIGPVELITDIVLNYLIENCPDGFILDGFPRTLYQAETLQKKVGVDLAILLSISENEIYLRRFLGLHQEFQEEEAVKTVD